jgi:NitT/TauT family transport system permease protein
MLVFAIGPVFYDSALTRNAFYSTWLNLIGLIEAYLFALPIGTVLGLFSPVRALFQKHIEASRYLPLPALTGLFISLFGIEDNMKIQFLAFSLFVFLLPQVIQRVDDVLEIYVQTMFTIGATKWQTIRYVFIPYVLAKSFNDLAVLSAITWTYIVVAEMVNANAGGLGAMSYLFFRQGKTAMGFIALASIIAIGFSLDKGFGLLDKIFFPFKFVGKKK